MTKILLIFEDYSELSTVQFTLKKVGFDCLGISTEFGTSEKVISFNPDIVIASGKGPRVSTIGVGRRLKEMPRWTGKAVLIFPQGSKPKPEELIKIRMDVVLEAPVENVRLIQVIAKLTNQDDQALMEKLIKSMAQENFGKDPNFLPGSSTPSEKVFVSGGSGGDAKKSEAAGGGAERKSDKDLAWSNRSEKDPESNTVMVRGFEGPAAENQESRAKAPPSSSGKPTTLETRAPSEKAPSEKTGQGSDGGPAQSSAFDELNRREQARARRTQFSLTPEPSSDEESTEPRFGNLQEKETKPSTPKASPPKKTAAEEIKDSAEVSVDKQNVDWSELENQLFQSPPKEQKPGNPSATAAETLAKTAGASELSVNAEPSSTPGGEPQFPLTEEASPAAPPAGPNYAQQVRQAEKSLAGKMKNYQEMTQGLKAPQESTLKRSSSRKIQIELMKDWKQVELEKQDELRREFTKALFKKK